VVTFERSRMVREAQDPGESVVALIDYQPRMFVALGSHDREVVLNNAVALAKAAKLFGVPVVLSTVAIKTFNGGLQPEIQSLFPAQDPIDRTTMNSWEDKKFRSAVTYYERKKRTSGPCNAPSRPARCR
jgi:nicotinamidase-related amidase